MLNRSKAFAIFIRSFLTCAPITCVSSLFSSVVAQDIMTDWWRPWAQLEKFQGENLQWKTTHSPSSSPPRAPRLALSPQTLHTLQTHGNLQATTTQSRSSNTRASSVSIGQRRERHLCREPDARRHARRCSCQALMLQHASLRYTEHRSAHRSAHKANNKRSSASSCHQCYKVECWRRERGADQTGRAEVGRRPGKRDEGLL